MGQLRPRLGLQPLPASLPASSLLASSCSGPSRQDERTTARLIQSPGIGHDLPVSGRVVLPRALRFPPKEKISKNETLKLSMNILIFDFSCHFTFIAFSLK